MKSALAVILLAIGLETAAEPISAPASEWHWDLPSYIPVPRIPADNPMSEAKFELGRLLFYDPRLSGTGTLSCASCHEQAHGFSIRRNTGLGSTNDQTQRNPPGLSNLAWRATYSWANPALVTLESQMEVPLLSDHPIEMGMNDANRAEILARLRADPAYPSHFREAFPSKSDPVTFDDVIKAIATFERGLISFNSRYDLYLQGKASLTQEEQRGREIFFSERGECHHCHGSANFDDQFISRKSREIETPFHNTGLYNVDGKGGYPQSDRGLFEVTGEPSDVGKFRAPSLRNVAVSGPYMHDGSVATLEEVIEIYSAGGHLTKNGSNAGDGRVSPFKDDLIVAIDLNDQEKADLVAFLKTLTDDAFLTSPRYANPRQNTAAGAMEQKR